MKIVYIGNNQEARKKILAEAGDVLLLLYDRWDDFGYKSRFPTICRIGGKDVELGALRILFADQKSSHPFLAEQRQNGWDGEFPVEGAHYLSVPEEITFYEQLLDLLPEGAPLKVAERLHDASYLAHVMQDADALAMIETEGFRTSLQRERSSQNSFADGWRLLNRQVLNVADLSFTFRDPMDELSTLRMNFAPKSLLPHDINVIIGPNGVGKSSLLRQMVRAWIQPKPGHKALNGAEFNPRPNLSQLVAVSYSPFERMPVDTDDEESLAKPLKDKDIYRFFGFRGRHESQKTGRQMRIRHSLAVPKANATRSLIHCLTDDLRYSTMKAWANKLRTLHRVLGSAITFDVAAVRLQENAPIDEIVTNDAFEEIEILELEETDDAGEIQIARYVPVAPGTTGINVPALLQHVDLDDGVTFFDQGKPLRLSSGQRLFFYIVVNILGVIRRNSLVIVDEPELFLHPTLEVQFVSMLKQILRTYGSKALLATHSVVTVREVPSRCVHVFEATDDGLAIKTPPFETFGGDVQRIASYVFGDRSTSKPHEAWLRELLDRHGTADELIEALGADLNEEMIIQLHAMERGKW
ncbi:ABC-type cobalamin/Fe3+-siderophores transport system ATPase subunit (plasmid) [Ensifer sp. WSM1721]|uniref:ATP-binding protein n=1 Tax=Ensifer sp. WSM1721 TaxID=1041159 RepID=UPI00047A059A|nr:ATP-binding protein [Ensifer sp. WSM1721]